jgi:hypothetical protein
MKMKSFLCIILVGGIALNAAFGQKAQMTGTVVNVTTAAITVQKPNDSKWVWEIKIGPNTIVTGKAELGSQVTVSYNVPDAQKKEAPTTNPTVTPAGQ